MNYIVDEFANIPTMQNMDSMITAARSRNIRFNLIVQSKMQLEDKYKAIASVICDNCNNWLYLYSKDYGLLSEISRLCGEVIYDNHMHLPLISEFDLQHLKKEEGEALVLAGRNYPCITNLMDIDDYPEMKEKELPDGRTKQWSEVPVFSLNKQKLKDYTAYIPKKGMSPQKLMDSFRKENTWLVGTYNGMILVQGLMTRHDAESGKGLLRLCVQEVDDWKGVFDMDWYISTDSMQASYIRQAAKAPEKVFLTIDELGKDSFIPYDKKLLAKLKGVGV